MHAWKTDVNRITKMTSCETSTETCINDWTQFVFTSCTSTYFSKFENFADFFKPRDDGKTILCSFGQNGFTADRVFKGNLLNKII